MSAFSLRVAPIAIAVALAVSSPSLYAQSTTADMLSTPFEFNTVQKPLAQALSEWALQTRVQMIVQPALVAGKSAPAISGTLTPRQAVDRLLSGSGLVAIAAGNAMVVTVAQAPADAETLPMVTVIAQPERTGTTEGTGSYSATGPSTTATGLPMALQETPQSVSVVTRQQMQDRNMHSLDDVADVATGITYSKLGTQRSTFYSRGFPITDLQVDGVSTSVAESYSGDAMSLNNMAIYDRIEIVRGANGLLQGSGNPSAVINMVRKRPTRQLQMNAELGAGSWADYRAQLDVSGPLNAAGTLRGRTVVFANNGNSFKTGAGKDNKLLYAVAEADLGPATMLAFGATLQKDHHKGYDWGGLNTRLDGSFYELPRATSLAGPWAHLNRDSHTFFGDLTHKFDNEWTLSAAVHAVHSDASFLSPYPARVSGDTYRLPISATQYKDDQLAFNLKASGSFALFGRQHELMLGASSRRDDFSYDIQTATNTPTVEITNFDFWTLPQPQLNAASSHYALVRKEKGLVAATRLHATDRLSFILGGRISWADYASNSPYTNASFNSGRQIIPYAGLVYKLGQQHAIYASYTDIYSIQQYYSETGLLEPVQGKNYEVGVKSEFFDQQLSTALAIFQTDQLNLPVATSAALTCGLAGNSRCYTAGAKVRNRGIDIEMSGSPTPNWNVAAGLTFSDPEYVAGPNQGKDYNTTLARKVMKISTDYQLPGGQWRLGANVQLQSGMHYDGGTYYIAQDGYALLNVSANYRHDRHLSVQFNVRNALDKHYYQSIPSNNNFGGLYVGTPRSFAVTLRYDY